MNEKELAAIEGRADLGCDGHGRTGDDLLYCPCVDQTAVDVRVLLAALSTERARGEALEDALKTIAKGVWIAKADACLDTIGFIAREGLRKAVEQARVALVPDQIAGSGGAET